MPAPSRLTLWLWIALGIVLLVISSPYWIGAFLGDEYSGHARAVFSAPPEVVWKAVEDYRSHPLGGSAAHTVGELPTGGELPAWIEDHSGRSIRVTTLEVDPGRRCVREMHDRDAAFSARWTIELLPREEETELRVHQDCTVAGGLTNAPLRFVMRFLDGARLAPRSYLEELAKGLAVRARFSE
jgi:hypothetical protein